jgi:hypothetical protein
MALGDGRAGLDLRIGSVNGAQRNEPVDVSCVGGLRGIIRCSEQDEHGRG